MDVAVVDVRTFAFSPPRRTCIAGPVSGPKSRPRRASVSARNRQRGVRRRIPGAFLHRAAVAHLFRRMMGPRAGAGREFAQLQEQVPSRAGRGHWEAHFAGGGQMTSAKCRTRKGARLSRDMVSGNVRGGFSCAFVPESAPGDAGSGRKCCGRCVRAGAPGTPKTSTATEKVLIT